MAINIETTSQEGVAVVVIQGEIDSATAPQVQNTLLPLVQQHDTLVLDLAGVPYMSSAGLRTMLLLYRQALTHNGKLILTGVAEPIKDTMSITGFLKFFVLCDTTAAALEGIKRS